MAETPAGEPSDRDLLRSHVDGDPDAFGMLFKRHSSRLWAVALRITCNSDDAADVLQDAMISAFRRAGDFRGDSAVTTWLHRIVVNSSLDLLRHRSAQRIAWSGNPEEFPVPEPRQVVDNVAGTDARLDITAALGTLAPPLRAALVLVDMLGYSVADAAVVLEVPEGTVKSRCARGRAKLLPHLAHLRDGSSGTGSSGARSLPVPNEVTTGGSSPHGRNQVESEDVSVQQGVSVEQGASAEQGVPVEQGGGV
jgi:RNA polymerase sigma-70 factor, ECF subfamily